MSTTLDKAKIISDSDLPQEAKTVGVLGALLGVDNDIIIKNMVGIMDTESTKEAETKTPLKSMPEDYTPTQKILHQMLTENTGTAMMDSGGVYGRHWQSNRAINDFRLIPRITIRTHEWRHTKQFEITKSLFHYLDERLEYDPKLSYKLIRFSQRKDQKENYWIATIEDFIKEIGAEDTGNGNSYNHDNLLSQDFQWNTFTYGDTEYVVIQTHNGCDIRGGYSTPRVFRVVDDMGSLYDFAYVNASCDCTDSYTQDGYYWDGGKKGIPEVWGVSVRKNGVYCRECKHEVNFT